jgi:hypothetical protein
MSTEEAPTLSQVIDWLDEGALVAASENGPGARHHHVVWAMLRSELSRMKQGQPGVDHERARWVLTWLRYVRYQGATTLGVRQAVVAVASGAKARHVAAMLGRDPKVFNRKRLLEFRERVAVLVMDGLRQDYGVAPGPEGLSFTFVGGCLT